MIDQLIITCCLQMLTIPAYKLARKLKSIILAEVQRLITCRDSSKTNDRETNV